MIRLDLLIFAGFVGAICLSATMAQNVTQEGKILSVFQVVKFPNDLCKPSDTTKNGTCYTSSECSSRDGTSSGTCAEGFGVCCIFSLSCGSSSSENCTYLEMSSFTAATTSPCTYKICKSSDSICRIRLDFTELILADPPARTATAAAITTPTVAFIGTTLGNCLEDSLTIGGAGAGDNANAICGTNTNQHVYVDALSACNFVNFAIGDSSTTTRSWNIKVTQYNCGDTLGGPPGCLQYQYGTSGTVRSFNFPETTSTTSTPTNTQHLSNMAYDVCFRREVSYCKICYTPTYTTLTTLTSYGLSVAQVINTIDLGADEHCVDDYITIPVGVAATTASATAIALTIAQQSAFCGRKFTYTTTAIISSITSTVCSWQNPFRMGVHMDQGEFVKGLATTNDDETELVGLPAGTWGFSLDWFQIAC